MEHFCRYLAVLSQFFLYKSLRQFSLKRNFKYKNKKQKINLSLREKKTKENGFVNLKLKSEYDFENESKVT